MRPAVNPEVGPVRKGCRTPPSRSTRPEQPFYIAVPEPSWRRGAPNPSSPTDTIAAFTVGTERSYNAAPEAPSKASGARVMRSLPSRAAAKRASARTKAQITGEYDGYASSASEGSTYLPSRRPRKRLAGLAAEVSPRGDPALSKSAVGEKAGADEPPFTSRLAVSDWARRTAQATGVFREIEAEE
ncbi:hypothetical protein K525DRAFT_246493, partial [Schizophyllum commune Loenen D]